MPGGASKLRDVRKLADTRSTFDLDLPVAEMPGLPVELVRGRVHVHLQFGREQGFMIAQVGLRAQLELLCQRCMGSMPLSVEASSQVALVESETQAEGAPVGWETYLAADGRLNLAALAAEELLLALPIVPVHAAAECGALAAAAAQSGDAGQLAAAPGAATPAPATALATARPFADLRALLERGAKTTK